jgi:hypothetical protein
MVTDRPDIQRPESLLDRLAPVAYGDERPADLAAEGDVLDVGRREWSEAARAEEAEAGARLARMAEHLARGTPPDDAAVLDEIDAYHAMAARYGGAGSATFASLGDLLVGDGRLRSALDGVRYDLAQYHRQAIAAYVEARLTEGGA